MFDYAGKTKISIARCEPCQVVLILRCVNIYISLEQFYLAFLGRSAVLLTIGLCCFVCSLHLDILACIDQCYPGIAKQCRCPLQSSVRSIFRPAKACTHDCRCIAGQNVQRHPHCVWGVVPSREIVVLSNSTLLSWVAEQSS